MLTFHFVNGTPVLITAGLSIFTDKALDPGFWWSSMRENYPYPYQMMTYCQFEANPQICVCGGMLKESKGTNVMLAAILVEIALYCLLVFLGPWYIYHCLKTKAKMVTVKKYNHEKKVILSLFFQVGSLV